MIHPAECECIACLVDRSSLGSPEAKRLRASVSDEAVARVMRRLRELSDDDDNAGGRA